MNNWELVQMSQEATQLQSYIKTNEYTGQFGLTLSNEDASALVIAHQKILKDKQRFEFGEGILTKIIFAFCDSNYINQKDYKSTLIELEDIFYEYKNESNDLISDDELVNFMRKAFDGVCYGSLDYLRGTVLANWIHKVKYEKSGIWEAD